MTPGILALLADGYVWSVRELAEVGRWNEPAVAMQLGRMARDGRVRMVGVTGWVRV